MIGIMNRSWRRTLTICWVWQQLWSLIYV